VIPLGNAHLASWSDSLQQRRDDVRARQRWNDKLVVLNVCRFHAGERHYKGVDAYAALLNVARTFAPALAERVVFVLVGKADPSDVDEMTTQGLTVFANVSDAEMVDLYAAADAYINLSRWEGYNLGIGQALALGLPTLASDIPAHRAFGVPTTDDVAEQVAFLEQLLERGEPTESAVRVPTVWSWDAPLDQLTHLIDTLAAGSVQSPPASVAEPEAAAIAQEES
jgi:glycosyltransferase involved in cell wall biosynthesis